MASDERPQVIVTRPAPDGAAFAAIAERQGLRPILSPAMVIEIEEKPVDLSDVTALAFTSANGVRAFAANSQDRTLPVFSVGAVTAAAAREAGFETVSVAGGDLTALTQLIAEAAPVGHVLHIAGADRAGDLVASLASRKISCNRLTLYQAQKITTLSPLAKAALSEPHTGIWTALFSPRTADIFIEQVLMTQEFPKHATLYAACFSEAVARRAAAGPFKEVCVAETMTTQSMIDLMTPSKFSS